MGATRDAWCGRSDTSVRVGLVSAWVWYPRGFGIRVGTRPLLDAKPIRVFFGTDPPPAPPPPLLAPR